MPPPAEPPGPDLVRCPTCRADQPWSETCRRCKSDLRLLREVAESYLRARRACLLHLRSNRPQAARDAALRAHALAPTEESRRLMALAALLREDWPAAAELAGPG